MWAKVGVRREAAGTHVEIPWHMQPTFKGIKRTWGIFLRRVLYPSPHARVGIPMGRRVLAKSVSDEWSPETLHGVMSVMAATLLSLKGHFCPSFTPNREKIPLCTQKSHGST
jgi:hypothetical protein